MPCSPLIPLPKGWTKAARRCVLHAISVASTAMLAAWAKAASGRSPRKRALAEIDRLQTEVALLKEELDMKDARWARVPARRRPHYGPMQRMRILELRAARGWSNEQTAQRFLITEDTVTSWMRRLDEGGEAGLVQTPEPVNKFPAFVAYMVRYLKRTCPTLGKRRIAQMLARAGLHLGATTVGRMLRQPPTKDEMAGELPVRERGPVGATRPNHIWHVDLTVVPTSGGFWVPWMPYAKIQRWPFCWWVAVALDHTSRLVIGFAIFKRRPDSRDVCSFLGRAIRRAGAKPAVIISDRIRGRSSSSRTSRGARAVGSTHVTARWGSTGASRSSSGSFGR